jgi:phytoene dehydrogenase-like protein
VTRARAVAANVGPALLYRRLIEPDELPAEFNEAMARYQCGSGTFRINVALRELPDFAAAPGTQPQPHHASGIVFAPSLAYMDAAWHDAVARGFSAQPIVEMLIPSVVDDTLAPAGMHVASLFCQQFRPEADWSALKEAAVQAIFGVVPSCSRTARTSATRCSAGARCRPPTSRASSGSSAATSSTAGCRSTSCSRCARCWDMRSTAGR